MRCGGPRGVSWWTERPGFWPILGAVLAAHGVLLSQLPLAPSWTAAQGQQEATPVVMVRAVATPAAAATAAALPPPATAAVPPRTAAADEANVAAKATGALPPPIVASKPLSAEPPRRAAAEAPYVPRGELTVPPRIVTEVQVPFPADIEGIVDLRVQLALFIDEEGRVRRIRIDTPDVHPAFQREIREAFFGARFSPGEIDGAAVRSRLHLVVEFHSP